ncbi:MAG: pyrroloquinoline quinone biosynthesis protein PqqB [Casimicrobiaceae bacterium]
MTQAPYRLRVLGSAAGGGYPQWNCNCTNCDGLRRGTLPARARTQSSIAVSANAVDWLLVNASPDLLAQIRANALLQPARAKRDTGIAAVLLVDAQIDHVTGLLMLREHTRPLHVLASQEVLSDLSSGFPVLPLLGHYCGVETIPLPLDGRAVAPPTLPEVTFTPIPLASKPPPYSKYRERPRTGDNIGVIFHNPISRQSVFYAPGLGHMDEALLEQMSRCTTVLVDGTFWSNDEMQQHGLSSKTALDMGHLPQSGPDGMVSWLDRLPSGTRKLLIHINNTNPILDERSAQRAELEAHGIEVAHDGLELRF